MICWPAADLGASFADVAKPIFLSEPIRADMFDKRFILIAQASQTNSSVFQSVLLTGT